MTSSLRRRASITFALLLLALPAVAAAAQDAVRRPVLRAATRADLESAAAELDQLAASTAYGERLRASARTRASALRVRLTDGDFRPGDKILVVIEGQLAVSDTLAVLEGLRLPVPGFRAVSLAGVLRSELEAKLRTELTDVVRNATVTARPLIRLAVFGAVAQPGYLSVPAETTLDELLMLAGGPNADAGADRMKLTRADTILAGSPAIRAALSEGRTVGALDLTDGDVLQVPLNGPPWDRNAVIQFTGFLLSIVTILAFRLR